MTQSLRTRFAMASTLTCFAALSFVYFAVGQEPQRPRDTLREPVYRISKARVEPRGNEPVDAHPLDPALRLARDALKRIRTSVNDYSATVVKRERVRGKLNDQEFMYAEVRNQKTQDGQIAVPFGVYLYFLKPSNIKGREVIWVEGRNNNKLVAHEGGVLGLAPAVWLRPEGPIAMRGQLYPISDIGIENLITKLIEKGERDRLRGECDVKFIKGAKINGRSCTVLQVSHPVPRPHFDFHVARIFIDDELQLPIRYAAYSWPKREGENPPLLEEYTYLNLKLNPGLTDEDFDHAKKFRG